jgi:hypothetical protein
MLSDWMTIWIVCSLCTAALWSRWGTIQNDRIERQRQESMRWLRDKSA